jgi:hypothetical protein
MCGVDRSSDGSMTHQNWADPFTGLDLFLSWGVNLFILAVLPTRLGMLGAPLWFFMVYAALAGGVLTLTGTLRHPGEIISRADLRDYALVRVALVALCGLVPFAIGRALFW